MPFYHKLGKIPQKRHTQFRQPDGSLYHEELFSTIGFDSILSNAYHINPPARIDNIDKVIIDATPIEWNTGLRPYHFMTKELKTESDFVSGRKPLLFNNDVIMSVCRPDKMTDYFYKNASADEVIFVHEGEGVLESNFGFIKFKKGDYLVIPRSITYRLNNNKPLRLLIFESFGPIKTPKRYRNEFGQLLEHSPFCERDIRVPEELFNSSDKGDFVVKVKKENMIHSIHYDYHPFDIVGYDGFYFPWIFNIDDFMPITGKIHMPPPIHQTFEAPGFVICSFVSRLLDYHELAIPVPYSHSNVDSDEVLYYADGNFFSRRGIDYASISLHPGGLTHGPHPGTTEAALGKLETFETAVMMDTFRPLKLTNFARELNDENYYLSWKD